MTAAEFLVVMSLVAGVAGTGVGGLIGVLFAGKGNRIMSRMLSFAAGIMVGVVCFDLIPESVKLSQTEGFEYGGMLIMVASVAFGIVLVYYLNKLVDYITLKSHDMAHAHVHNATHIKPEELHHEQDLIEESAIPNVDRKSLLKAGIIMLLAIALHNFPEGMAIGSTGVNNEMSGVVLAIIIALHNIPEGIAIAAPMAGGGIKKWLAVLLTALAGATTIVGAAFGILVGGVSDLATGICIGFAGGAMLYVTFGEIMPQSILLEEGRLPAISMLIGLVGAAVIVFAM